MTVSPLIEPSVKPIDMPSVGMAQRLSARYGYMQLMEVAALQDYARMLKHVGEPVVNIGAGYSTSGAALLEAHPTISVVTVDIDKVRLEDDWQRLRMGLGDRMLRRYAQILSDSGLAGTTWAGGPLGMVFVDGDHSYDGCLRDLLAWAPHVRQGGWMALHDYDAMGESSAEWAVTQATQDFLRLDGHWAFAEVVRNLAFIQRVEC